MEREAEKYCLQENKQLSGKINGSLGDEMGDMKAGGKVYKGVCADFSSLLG